jgi:hypothetical protein
MAKLNQRQCQNLISDYFLVDGWIPPGTPESKYLDVQLKDMGIDDPPVPGDPHLQKKRIALDLQSQFRILGSSISSPLAELKVATRTLGELADWCCTNQGA